MWDRVLKAITDRDTKNSGMHLKGGEGIVLVAHEEAPIDDEV